MLLGVPEPREVESMFARIAGRYDFLNRVLSAGIDQRWRRRTVRLAEELAGPLAGRPVLDVCCGTGDLTLAFRSRGARAVGVDFTAAMLARAHPKRGADRVLFGLGDALRLPVADASVDVASVAFGLRNVADRRRGLSELARVLRPGGVALVLEFTLPRARVLRGVYGFYFTRVLPRIGAIVSGDGAAYDYLPDSVRTWPAPDVLEAEMAGAGLERCGHVLLSGGIAALHYGRRPDRTA
jgi:demethylmenaquinone methyltransferase / 2-methoxy-6-polyprenyl-1,4-benzoquinol methylase